MAEEDETREQLEARQEAEEEELDEKAKGHLAEVTAKAGKGKKAKAAIEAAEREVDQWRYDLSERHKEEMEALEERADGGAGDVGGGVAASQASAAAAQKEVEPPGKSQAEEEAERLQHKKDKAQKKRQDKSQKQKDKEADIEREKREAGPSRRELEMAELITQLAKHKPHLQIHEVIGDGHCLYRAIADQLRRYRPDLHNWVGSPDTSHEEMRSLCAKALRRRKDEYEPFAELATGEAYSDYCGRVESSADWGGHLELRALADELGGQILVYRAGEKEPLSLGSSGAGTPLCVTFHQFWLAAGEHYNSAILQA